jgi:hypothetical protein
MTNANIRSSALYIKSMDFADFARMILLKSLEINRHLFFTLTQRYMSNTFGILAVYVLFKI